MTRQLVVKFRTQGRVWPTFFYFAMVLLGSLKLYVAYPSVGPWLLGLLSILIGVPIYRCLATTDFVLSDQPKSIQREFRVAGILLKSLMIDPTPFRWVRSRTGAFDPRHTIIELGMEHSYDAVPVQTIRYAMGETPEVIRMRSEIAGTLGIADRGHERLPLRRVTS